MAMLNIAHRGGSGLRPENTLAAFAHALELGCDGAELDVHLSKDGQLVVHHDARLNHLLCRTKSGVWLDEGQDIQIADLNYEELLQYEVGVPKPQYRERFPLMKPFEGQRIPLLREVIHLVKSKSDSFILVIEIKSPVMQAATKPWHGLVDAVLELVRAEHFLERTVLCSFDWSSLLYAKAQIPQLPTWFTTHPLSWLAEGEPPVEDLRPREEYLERLRLAYHNNAPWYAGFHPRQYHGSYPSAIKAAGGSAWFLYHTDVNPLAKRQADELDLPLAAWSVNATVSADRLALLMANANDYPNE